MRKILLTLAAAAMPAFAMGQTADTAGTSTSADAAMEPPAPGSNGAAIVPSKIMLPYAELQDSGMEWQELEPGKFYEISQPAFWTEEPDSASAEPFKGWIMEEKPGTREYISVNEFGDMLTWLSLEERMIEQQATDSTVETISKIYISESVHTVEISGEYLDRLGSLSGPKRQFKSLQIMKYNGCLVIHDYVSKYIRHLSQEPHSKEQFYNTQN